MQDRSRGSNIQCITPQPGFQEIVDELLSTRYSVFGEFLDLQLLGSDQSTKWMIFAPDNDEMCKHLGNFSDYGSIFRRHVVPCKLTVVDLAQETEVLTFLKGYTIKITTSGEKLALNRVPIVRPNVYSSDPVVVHGIEKILCFQEELHGISGDSVSGFHGTSGKDVDIWYEIPTE